MSTQPNGVYKLIEETHEDVKEIKDHLANSVDRLSKSVDTLTKSVDGLTTKQEHIYTHALQSIPIKFVFYLFFIVSVAFAGGAAIKEIAEADVLKHLIMGK